MYGSFIHHSASSSSRHRPKSLHLQFNPYGDLLKGSPTSHFRTNGLSTAPVVGTPLVSTLASTSSLEVVDECMYQLLNGLRDEENVESVMDDRVLSRVGGSEWVSEACCVNGNDIVAERLSVEDSVERDEVLLKLLLTQQELRDTVAENQRILQSVQQEVRVGGDRYT